MLLYYYKEKKKGSSKCVSHNWTTLQSPYIGRTEDFVLCVQMKYFVC